MLRIMKHALFFLLLATAFSSCSSVNSTRFSGVGISVAYDSTASYPYVVEVLSGKPGAMAGLRSGDYITAVDDKSTAHISATKTLRWLRGLDGSGVNLQIKRGEQQLTLPMLRQKYQLQENPGNMCLKLDSLLQLCKEGIPTVAGQAVPNSQTQWKASLVLPKFESAYVLGNPELSYRALYFRGKDSVQCRRKYNELNQQLQTCFPYTCCPNPNMASSHSLNIDSTSYSITEIKDSYSDDLKKLSLTVVYMKYEPQVWFIIRRKD